MSLDQETIDLIEHLKNQGIITEHDLEESLRVD
jgi:hypothetical protein